MTSGVALAMMTNAPPEESARAVASARGYVDRAVVVVAPGHRALVPAVDGLPTRIVERAWEGHAATRTKTLRAAEEDPEVDWVLMLDAHARVAGALPALDARVDAYEVAVEDVASGWRWMRPGHLLRARRGFSWAGTAGTGLHETLALPEGAVVAPWPALVVRGVSSPKPAGAPRTYADDAAALALAPPDDARAAFYHAQSLKDAGRHAEALTAFERRAAMGGWDEEVFWAKLWAGKLAAVLALPRAEIVARFAAAAAHAPDRAEPLAEMARTLRAWGEDGAANAFAHEAWSKPYPASARLFVATRDYSPRALAAAGLA